MPKYFLGISAYYHDSAATLLSDGKIIAAAQEERFTRKKHDSEFPVNAIQYCIEHAGIKFSDIQEVVFYDKPLVKFERLLETYLAYAPKGILSFFAAMPVWIKEKLFLKSIIKKEFIKLSGKGNPVPKLLFTEHHQSHAASAFFVSPFESSAVLCMDGVGEWATSSVWKGEGNTLTPLWQIDFPHSLGLLYSAFTYYTGFKVNSGEYKVMGLAPYGEPKYKDLIYKHLIDVKEDGTFRLNMEYFNYATGLTMTNSKFHKIFGGPPRKAESKLGQKEMDLARSVQEVTEEVMIKICRTIRKETGLENLCMAGGVALNCVANGKILEEKIFKNIFIQPAAGDAGGSLGAALSCYYEYHGMERTPAKDLTGSIDGSYLGSSFSIKEIKSSLDKYSAKYEELDGDEELNSRLAEILADGNIVGYFQGRMEFGPRALGARSIIGDPRNTKMQSDMNLKIKYRESFRPFAPAILAERVSDYFDIDSPSPYMLIVAPIKKEHRIPMTPDQEQLFGIDKLNVPRSSLPAITHVDYSARIQTVHASTNPKFYNLLKAFDKKTGCPVLVNTSFNVRGEPIVHTPEDAFRCFMRTEMDYLVLENILIYKKDQTPWEKDESWMNEFELD